MFVRMIVTVPASVPVRSNDAYVFQIQKNINEMTTQEFNSNNRNVYKLTT